MNQSTLSMAVSGAYITFLGTGFLFIPNLVSTLLGFEPVSDVWIRNVGPLLLILGFYFLMAIREQAYGFYKWTVFGRLPILFVFLAFVILGYAPPTLLLFGAFDSSCALWTAMALKKEQRI